MPSLGVTEIMVILVVALIFIGPKKLPQVSRSIGRAMREFRDQTDAIKREFNEAVDLDADLAMDDTPKSAAGLTPPPAPAPGTGGPSRLLPGATAEAGDLSGPDTEPAGETTAEDTA